ncbi:MAG: hypothetical protein Q6366_010265 [Candidatus Freyarchaeota archaeon]
MNSVIRVSSDVRNRLEILKRKLHVKSMSQLLEIIINLLKRSWISGRETPKRSLKV